MENKIEIYKDFGINLGGRKGLFSGEEFYKLLEKKFLKSHGRNLLIFLDGVNGYSYSFLDESFGKLARNYGVDEVDNIIIFHTNLFQWNVDFLKEKIWKNKKF